MFQPKSPKNEEPNDNMQLKDYILHVDLAKTSFDVNQNKKDTEETEAQTFALNNRVCLL